MGNIADFDVLVASPARLKALLEGSHIYGDAVTFDYWYLRRSPIVRAIHRPGTILDVGCANGFLLRSLQAWSVHDLVPYGIDPDRARLAACSELFPDPATHFASLSVRELSELPRYVMPATYDFVYWNVWDDFSFAAPAFQGYLDRILATVRPGGRLILGFYDADKARTETKLTWLVGNFRPATSRHDNAPFEEVFVWWDV